MQRMATIYCKAGSEIIERGKALVEKYHFPVENAGVRIDYIIARATVDDDGEPTGPAVSLGGYPCFAIARVLGSKDRVMGRGDCEIVIDGDRWDLLTKEQQDALIDHELEHFQVKVDKYGNVVLDDSHRPKLKIKKHDHQFGWFDSIARRHGQNSIEVGQFKTLCEHDETGQYYLPFLTLSEGSPANDTVKKLASRFVKNMKRNLGPGESIEIGAPGMKPVIIKGSD